MQMADGWPQIGKSRTLTEEVYEEVRRRLLSGYWSPGAFIREADLATAMGVSRTPVREALGRLASEGWVERIPHRGFQVPQRSMEELLDLYPVLQALEALAGELAFPRLDEAGLREMEEANAAFEAALERNDTFAAVELNDRYHEVLSDHCGNPVLREMLKDIREEIRRVEFVDFMKVLEEVGGGTRRKWVRQHQQVVDAVRLGDFEVAKETLHENRSIAYLQAAQVMRNGAPGREESEA
jgi:DNA-binding GntR family transcriptional regulator